MSDEDNTCSIPYIYHREIVYTSKAKSAYKTVK